MTLYDEGSEDAAEPNYSRRDSNSSSSNNRILAVNLVSSRQIEMKSVKMVTSWAWTVPWKRVSSTHSRPRMFRALSRNSKDIFRGGSNDETEVRQDGSHHREREGSR